MKNKTIEKRILILEYKSEIQTVKNDAVNRLELITELHKEVKALNLFELTSKNLSEVIKNPTGYVRSHVGKKITDTPVFGGFSMNKQALIDQLDLPDTSKVEALATRIKKSGTTAPLDYFIVADDKVQLNEVALNEYCENFQVYAENEKQVELFTKMQEVADAVNKFNQYTVEKLGMSYNGSNFFSARHIAPWFEFGPDSVKPSTAFYIQQTTTHSFRENS